MTEHAPTLDPTLPASFFPIEIAGGVRTSARRTPSKIALEDPTRALTYAQLVERIDRVGNGVTHGLGLVAGQHAAIFAPNCTEFIEIVLGLASVGVAPAMVNAKLTAHEAAYICNDAEARVLFVHHSLEEVARAAELETVEQIIVIGDDYENWLANAQPRRPAHRPQEWDDFCIPYTAGTTGNPKGVLLSHRARTLTFYAMAVEFGCFGPDDRTLGIAPLFHGAGFAFSVAPIFFGGYTRLMPRFDAEESLRLLAETRATNVFMVPTFFSAIFGLGEEKLGSYDLAALRTIICNAAPLAQSLKERIVAHFGEGLLYECYGSTEASIVTSLRPADQLRKEQCVGLPFPCTEIRLVDEDGNDVAQGEVGELYSRSPTLYNGYWRKPEATQATFRDGWFSAGDLARQDEEGYVYLVDRKDDKIISGAVNIYPREVEEALLRHPAVADAAVYGIPNDHWGEAVHATVALHRGATATADELIEFTGTVLSRYKRPKGIDVVERLPRNAAGKVLRRELREPFWAGRTRRI